MSVVTTVAGLKVISSPLANETYETTDFGTGLWYYDSTGSPSEDNTGTVIARTGGGVFRRIYPGKTVYASWFGAVGDGVTDDYDALQDAIDYLAGSGSLILEKGTFFLNKSIAGGLKLPTNAIGITIKGEDQYTTIIKLSRNVPRAFDLPGNNSTTTLNVYENISLEGFTVDANNIDGEAMGEPVTASDDGVVSGGGMDVNVGSTSGLLAKGLLFFPYTNTGSTKGKLRSYTVLNSTTIRVAIATDETIIEDDIIMPAISSHTLIGNAFDNGATGIYGYNVAANNITIKNIDVINIPSLQPTTTFGACQTRRGGISIFTALAPDYAGSVAGLENIHISNVRVFGGSSGFGVYASSHNAAFVNDITLESCYYDSTIIPTIQFDGYAYLIGNRGFGGKVIIRNCYGAGSGDVGIETDALTNAVVADCLVENCFAGGYYSTNFVPPVDDIDGAPTTTLSGMILDVSGTDNIVVSSIPAGIANEGYLSIDNELMYYTLKYNSTTIHVYRGLNDTPSVGHDDGALVIFAGLEKQKLTYERCVYRNTLANDSILGNHGWGWFQQRSTIYPNPATELRDCVYERTGTGLSIHGEAIFIKGANSSIDIDGFRATINGFNATVGTTKSGAAIQVVNEDYGGYAAASPIKPEVLRFKNIDLKINGILDTVSADDSYSGIYFTYGNYFLDWSGMRFSMNLLNTLGGQTYGINLGSLGSYFSGSISNFKFSTSGDKKPCGIFANSAVTIGDLNVINPDYFDMFFDTLSTLNYRPYFILSTIQGVVSFKNIRHPQITPISYRLTKNTRRRVEVTNMDSYTTNFKEEYLAIKNTTKTCAITLARAATYVGSGQINVGNDLLIADEAGTAATYNITITPSSGEVINGSATPYVINTNYGFVKLKAVPLGYIKIS